MPSIAIIGAGLSGLSLARQLQGFASCTVFEKSRGFGGRMATRRFESWQFDHGAQFFTARSPEFKLFLKTYIGNNVVWLWEPRLTTLEAGRKRYKRDWFEPHYIAVPGMNALCKTLAHDSAVRLQTDISTVEKLDQGWRLTDSKGSTFGPFDWVVSAVPAPQAMALLPDCFQARDTLEEVSFSPCFSLMLGFATPPQLHFDAAVVHNSPIGWIALNSSKVERSMDSAMVVHSSNEWAQLNRELESAEINTQLLAALQDLLGKSLPPPEHQALQRWLYAKTVNNAGTEFLLDEENQLAACGDWCNGDRVEDAYLSGLKLGEQIKTLI